jgi:hypothetical protein
VESSALNPRKNFLRALEALEQAQAGAETRGRPRLRWSVYHALANVYRERGRSALADEYDEKAKQLKLLSFSTFALLEKSMPWRSQHEDKAFTLSGR